MNNKKFLKAEDISEMLGVSRSKAYQIIKDLNEELEHKGYITVRGKISAKYFYERCYGVEYM